MDIQHMTDKTQADLRGWTTGPLPEALEQMALQVFCRQYPMAAWGHPVFREQRNDARRFVLQMRAAVMADAWTIESAENTLTEGSLHLLAGGRDVSDQTRHEVRQYAASYLEDLWPVFGPMVQRDRNRKVS